MQPYVWLVALGFLVGTFGTLIGAGGGFILMPVLLLLYPNARPETLASISLAVVFFNALSGSWAYARMKRIDYRSGIAFALASIPGAFLGALTTARVPRQFFDGIFGILLIALAAYLLANKSGRNKSTAPTSVGHTVRRLVENDGTVHTFSYDMRLGIALSMFVGYISSLLGIGGGIVHVPLLARLLDFPVHIATATSHFILAIMALTGTVVHIATGSFAHGGTLRTLFLGAGVLLGAQVGASLSKRIHGSWIIRGLAIALAFVGVRILILAISG